MEAERAEPSEEEVVEAIYKHAAGLVAAGRSPAEVRADLKAQGLDDESAATVTTNIFDMQIRAVQDAGKRNMLYGALWCIGGIAVTAITYGSAVSSPSGGRYVVAWGAIIVGAIQFFRGLSQSSGR